MGHVETLKRKDLLNYFRKIERVYRCEASSEDENYQSSSTDFKYRSQSRCAGKEFNGTRIKCRKSKSCKERKSFKKTKEIFNTFENGRYTCRRKSYVDSSKFVKKVAGDSVRNHRCQDCQFPPKFCTNYDKKDQRRKWEPEITQETNFNVIKKSPSVRKPHFGYKTFSTRLNYTSTPTNTTRKSNPHYTLVDKSEAALKEMSSNRSTPNTAKNLRTREFGPFFSVKDDLTSTEVLHYESLLKQQENKTPSKSVCFCSKTQSKPRDSEGFEPRSGIAFSSPSSRTSSPSPKIRYQNVRTPRDVLDQREKNCFACKLLEFYHGVPRSTPRRNTPRRRIPRKCGGGPALDVERTNILGKAGDVTCKNSTVMSPRRTGSGKLCKLGNTRGKRGCLACPHEASQEEEGANRHEYCHCSENVDNHNFPRSRLTSRAPWKKMGVEEEQTYPRAFHRRRNTDRMKSLGESELSHGEGEKKTFQRVKGSVCKESSPVKVFCRLPGKDERSCRTTGYKGTRSNLNIETGPRTRQEFIRTRIMKPYPSDNEFVLTAEETGSKKVKSSLECTRLRNDAKSLTYKCKEFSPNSAAFRGNADKMLQTGLNCTCAPQYTSYKSQVPFKSPTKESKRVFCTQQNVEKDDSQIIKTNHKNRSLVEANDSDSECDAVESPDAKDFSKFVKKEWQMNSANVRIVKPRKSSGKTNFKKILIYPPQGQFGSPLTLYKNASNITCKVKGDTSAGFRYDVTYVQNFVSPVWRPQEDDFFRGPKDECGCSSDYG